MTPDTTAYHGYQAQKYFANLDGLRFLCIAMVLWHHGQPIARGAVALADRGFLGVDFFFVLSGFLITTLLLRESDRNGQFSIKNFYRRRILRIFPVYFFVVTVMAVYFWQIKGIEVGHLLPYYYLFLSNFLTEHLPTLSITWSLSVEEQFYMLWPLTLLFVSRRYLPSVLIFAIAINVIVSAGWVPVQAPVIGQLVIALPNSTYAPILLGALLALVLHSKRGFDILYRLFGGKWAGLTLLLVLIVILQLLPSNVIGLPNLAIHTTMTLTLAAIVLRTDTALSRVFQNPILSRVGVISYGIYLYHMIARDFTVRIFEKLGITNDWVLLFTYSLASIVVAEISFRTLETYFRRFRPAD